jgi:hypothetical protein
MNQIISIQGQWYVMATSPKAFHVIPIAGTGNCMVLAIVRVCKSLLEYIFIHKGVCCICSRMI